MATIRQKEPKQWHAQVRRTGWPPITETLPTRKEAEALARNVESQMDRGIFVDRSTSGLCFQLDEEGAQVNVCREIEWCQLMAME
jgi:hypothetical protein